MKNIIPLASVSLSLIFSQNLFASEWYSIQNNQCAKTNSPDKIIESARNSPHVPQPQLEDIIEDGEIVAVKITIDGKDPNTRRFFKHSYMVFRDIEKCQNLLSNKLQEEQKELEDIRNKYR